MKYIFVILSILLLMPACCKGDIVLKEKEEEQLPHKSPIADLVLIYGGGAHRDVVWNKDHFTPYVSYTDRTNQESWLFDGFLFLEIVDGKEKIFATGYYGTPATKYEWNSLIDYFFTRGQSIDALDKCIAAKIPVLGEPPSKRKIIIALPEPIVAGPESHYKSVPADYWGKLDNRKLNFTNADDRVAACKYYIDRVKSKFDERKFQNLELAGFYWIAEESLHTKPILSVLGNYLNDAGFSFYWIPYWKNDPDYFEWKELGFHATYLQPNYFFNVQVPYSRLEEACKQAIEYDLDLEMEFDLRVFVNDGNRGSRLYDYMRVFRQEGIFANKRIAYYQDCDAVYQLYRSKDERNKAIFHDFCTFVLEHGNAYGKYKK